MYGYSGRILRVNLSNDTVTVDEPEENFYRRYFGGRGLIVYHLLKELKVGVDPLSPDNKLIFADGPVTGVPVGGCGRNSVGGKSPLTGLYGDAEVGGYWGAELKHAGYDAIIVEGKAQGPVYLWIKDDKVEIKDASHLSGKPTAEMQEIIRSEMREPQARTAAIGLAGENLVRYACIINDLNHAAGRTGMGAVMGSKNLKAIAVRGRDKPQVADPQAVSNLARWLKENVLSLAGALRAQGSASNVRSLNRRGGLPTRNFQDSYFEGADEISGRAMVETILVGRKSCFACPIHCKREVAISEPYKVDAVYGGPEYETIAALGSNCGISDLKAIAKGNELCNAYGLDTISTGAAIAFAMECFERGIINEKDTGGIELKFGNANAMLRFIDLIARQEGLGAILSQGVARASREIGKGSEEFAMHVKGQEIPMHEPRYKQGLGIGYGISPKGADHTLSIHDSVYTCESPEFDDFKSLGILEPLALEDLGPAKVRMAVYNSYWQNLLDCLLLCNYMPFNYHQVEELVNAVTGWNSTVWELMKVGERCQNLTRVFNIREGLRKEDDRLPKRFFTPLSSGPIKGKKIDSDSFLQATEIYYSMMGWDKATGIPTLGKLQELDIGWVSDYSGGKIAN